MYDIIKPGRRSLIFDLIFKCPKCGCIFRASGSDVEIKGPYNTYDDGTSAGYDYITICPWCNDRVTRYVYDKSEIYGLSEEDD